jgi:hypothetical protein
MKDSVESFVQVEGSISTPAELTVKTRLADFVEHNCFRLRWSDLSNIAQLDVSEEDQIDKTCSDVIEDLQKLRGVSSSDSLTTNELTEPRLETTVLFESGRRKTRPYKDLLAAVKRA